MAHRRFTPDGFTIGLLGVGLLMMIVPDLRVAGLIAMILAITWWVIAVVLRWAYRLKSK